VQDQGIVNTNRLIDSVTHSCADNYGKRVSQGEPVDAPFILWSHGRSSGRTRPGGLRP
jgi:hypothetical protein